MWTRRAQPARPAHEGARIRRHPRSAYALLALLGVWAGLYQLTDTVWPSLIGQAPFDWIWPDIAFALAGAMTIVAGLRGERGWILVGLGALCWASGDVYWQLDLSTLSSPPV